MIPPLRPLVLALLLLGCGEAEPPPDEPPAPTLPLAETPLAAGERRLVSAAGDTLRIAILAPERGRQRIVTTRSGASDSTSVLVDAATKAPIESFRRAVTAQGDTVAALLEYGRGFEGQARLTLTSAQARGSENVHTPPPALDAGQLPVTLAALLFARADTLSFNYVAPFEKRALAARLVIGDRDTLRIGDRTLPAWPVLLQVSGLEERAWFAAEPPHDLLRLEEITRRRMWTRVP